MRRLVSFAALTAALLTLAAPAPAAPTPPQLPDFGDLPGVETARFELVVEGTAFAGREIRAEGSNGLCAVNIVKAEVGEEFKFGRGKGLTVEAIRFGKGKRSSVILQRQGRGILDFAIKGKIRRDAKGSYERLSVGPTPCPAAGSFDFSTQADCGKSFGLTSDQAIQFNSVTGRIEMQPTSKIGALTQVEDCGLAPDGFGALSQLTYGWPGAPRPLAGTLAASKFFGGAKSFFVDLRAPIKHEYDPNGIPGPVSGSVLDTAKYQARLRFIRLGQ